MSKKAKKLKAPMMQKTKKFGKATLPAAKSTGYKGAKSGKSKSKGKKSFSAGAFANARKSYYKLTS